MCHALVLCNFFLEKMQTRKFRAVIEFLMTNASEMIFETNSCQVYVSRKHTGSRSIVFPLFFSFCLANRSFRNETLISENSHSRRPSFVRNQNRAPPKRDEAELPSERVYTNTPCIPLADRSKCSSLYRWRCVRRMIVKQRVANGRNERDTRVSRAIPRPDPRRRVRENASALSGSLDRPLCSLWAWHRVMIIHGVTVFYCSPPPLGSSTTDAFKVSNRVTQTFVNDPIVTL